MNPSDERRSTAPTPVRLGPREKARTLGIPLAVSIALHAAFVLSLLLLTGEGSDTLARVELEPLRATVRPSEPQFSVAESATSPRVDEPQPTSVTATDAKPAAIPLPPRPREPEAKTPIGNVFVDALDTDVPVAADMQATVEAIYAGAVRIRAAFEVSPPSLYPPKAATRQPQVLLYVLIVVDEEGRVALAEGTMGDPIYTPAIRAMLAQSKAHPHVVDGKPRRSWSLVSFFFEYAGGR